MHSESLSSSEQVLHITSIASEVFQGRRRAEFVPVAQSGQEDGKALGPKPVEWRTVTVRRSLRRLHGYGDGRFERRVASGRS